MKPIEPMEPMPLSTFERLRNNNIIQAWLVLILALFFGTALAGVQITLGPKIEQNKLNETLERVPELVLGKQGAAELKKNHKSLVVEKKIVSVEKNGKITNYSVFEAKDENKKTLGWVVKTGGQGYADRVELLLGLDPDIKKISGLFVLEQKETPGLGNKIVTDKWRGQFVGKDVEKPLKVVKGGAKGKDTIDAITGATISSRSVTNIINSAAADLKGVLAAGKISEDK